MTEFRGTLKRSMLSTQMSVYNPQCVSWYAHESRESLFSTDLLLCLYVRGPILQEIHPPILDNF